MLSQGLLLLVVGMGAVYAFLYLMVLVMRLIAVVVPRFNHLMPDEAPPVKRTAPTHSAVGADDGAVLALAIAVAAARGRR